MNEIFWSLQAIEDLDSIRAFIARDSERYAKLVAERLVAAVEHLARFPDSGRMVPELGDPRVREVLWRNYRTVYRRRESRVAVVTVFHGSLPIERK